MKLLPQLLVEGKNPFKGNEIGLDEAAGFVAKECRQSLDAPPIYTDGVGRFESFLVHPSQRKPQNVLEILVDDVLEKWSTYPKRTQSLVGTGRGGRFRIFPIDGANIAVAPSSFNESFQMAHSQLGDDFDVSINNLIQTTINAYNMRMGQNKQIPQTLNGARINDALNWSKDLWNDSKNRNINRILSLVDADEDTSGRMRTLLDVGERDIRQALETIFDPEETDIKTVNIKDMPNGAGEVWTDAPAVLVRHDVLGDL